MGASCVFELLIQLDQLYTIHPMVGSFTQKNSRWRRSKVYNVAMASQTLLAKVWQAHVVEELEGGNDVMFVDLHLVHELTSPQAFAELRSRGLKVRRPDLTLATIDHSIPTGESPLELADELGRRQMIELNKNCEAFGVPLLGLDSPARGIVHVIGPELGLTHPGMTIVCGDSHTSTHGAFGALAFGIGTSQVAHVLAAQSLVLKRPNAFEVWVEGRLQRGVTAKDVILFLLSQIGIRGGVGNVFEYRGPAIEAMSIEERMTICNMSIEAGANAGMIAPDEKTFAYLEQAPFAPKDRDWDEAVTYWKTLPSDVGAKYERKVRIHVSKLEPMVTFGTNPSMALPIHVPVPDPRDVPDSRPSPVTERAFEYMHIEPGRPMAGHRLDIVFIGSCTNSRLSDLRQAAEVLRGRRIAPGLRVLVVPGSQSVKRQAEREGLDRVFIEAGAEWRNSGCSMCIAMNGEMVSPGAYALSTSNRNFEGRQGRGARTILGSPLTAAASAITGVITDPREFM